MNKKGANKSLVERRCLCHCIQTRGQPALLSGKEGKEVWFDLTHEYSTTMLSRWHTVRGPVEN